MEEWRKEANKKLRHDIIADNKLLFKMAHRPMAETCMCWGLECGDGWLQPLADACGQLEGLNAIFYKLFNVRIQAAQIKEKFGTLHFYTDIVCDPCFVTQMYENVVDWLFDKLSNIDYKKTYVVDKPQYQETREEELSKEEYVAQSKQLKHCSSYAFLEKDGKYYKRTIICHCSTGHIAATKHKFLFWLLKRRWLFKNVLRRLTFFKPSNKQKAVMELLDKLQKNILQDAEKACYSVCEECGGAIGHKWSPRCQTTGWITYICQDCANSHKTDYYMNDEVWNDGKLVKNKEELAKERAEFANRLKKDEEFEGNEDQN